LNTWKSLPGVVTISGNPPPTLGTAASPQITVWQSSGGIENDSFTGYGILIFEGDVEIETDFEFHGVVVVNSSDRVRIRDGDSQGIYGAMIVASSSDTEVRLEDQTQVRYNCQDITDYAESVLPPALSGGSGVLAWRQI
ncbi:MAG: hypothetical protein ACE5K9_11370, partial [Candidatus Methylomirabilales bacterium]